MELLFWTLTALTAFTYFGYPIVIYVIAKIWGKEPVRESITPSVSLIIPAHNEERVIGEKVVNSLSLDYPKDKLEILFALDGCTDKTAEIIARAGGSRVKIIESNERGGKVSTLNKVVPLASGDIVVFSDANSLHDKDILKTIVRNFADTRVGCVCGRLMYTDTEHTSVGKGEGLYWKYEHFIKMQESRLGRLLVTNGSVQAIRKELYPYPDPDVADDFSIPLLIQSRGHALIFEPEAVVYEVATQSLKEEFRQKVRIIAQGMKGTVRLIRDLMRLDGLGMFEFLFHKSLRWFIPIFQIILFILNIFLLNNVVYRCIFALQCVFYALSIIGFLMRKQSRIKIFYIPFYLNLVNFASLVAIVRFARGDQTRTWEKAYSTRQVKAEVS